MTNNEAAVLAALESRRYATRAELMDITGITGSGMSTALHVLKMRGEVVRLPRAFAEPAAAGRGVRRRYAVAWRVPRLLGELTPGPRSGTFEADDLAGMRPGCRP